MVLTQKNLYVFIGIIVLFFALRLPGLHIPYHQDEYKWPLYSEAIVFPPGTIPHPPLTEFLYVQGGRMVGFDNFRYIPFTFGVFNLFLIFYLVKNIFNIKTALWAVFLFSISFYSVLAALMVDVDGAVMPFFLLLSAIGYYKLREKNFNNFSSFPSLFLLIGLVGGFLIKVIFVLPIAAFALDFAIEKQVFKDRKKIFRYLVWVFVGVGGLIAVLFCIRFIFPFFDLGKAVKYWKHFAVFAGRGWFQTFIQFTKSILYTSPLLILPAFLTNGETWQKLRPFFFFIFFGLFFYLFAFDFSLGALDRYFQFLIVPLCLISSAVFSKYLDIKERNWNGLFFLLASLLLFSIQFFNHFVPPQYPKTEWIGRVLSFKWNFLFPFTGGSGPTGFYISFVFMAIVWLISLILILSGLKYGNMRSQILTGVLMLGLLYNGVFIEEYLFGRINGSPYNIFRDAKAIIMENPNIKKVIVYNDIGGYEIKETGKYFRRMYATPQFESEYREILESFDGHILYINIPRIYSDGFYTEYMRSCKTVFSETDKYITGKILDCRK